MYIVIYTYLSSAIIRFSTHYQVGEQWLKPTSHDLKTTSSHNKSPLEALDPISKSMVVVMMMMMMIIMINDNDDNDNDVKEDDHDEDSIHIYLSIYLSILVPASYYSSLDNLLSNRTQHTAGLE